MAPLTAPVTSAMRTFGALLPSMLDLPSSPIETTNIAMGFKSTTNSLAEDGVVAWFAPYEDVAIIDNIEVRDVPLRAQPGQPFAFKLVIRDAYARTHPGAVELLRKHTRIYAYINETRTKLAFACTPLLPSLSAADDVKGVTVCISIPPGTDSQHVVVSGIRIAGTVLSFSPFPQTFDVLPGMDALDICVVTDASRSRVCSRWFRTTAVDGAHCIGIKHAGFRRHAKHAAVYNS
jgi:hypothetical protein